MSTQSLDDLPSNPGDHPGAPETLVEVLRQRALMRPQAQAFAQLQDGTAVAGTLDYATLDARARAIGGYLQGRGWSGKNGLLLLPEGLGFVEAFFGSLYGGLVPAPLPAPDLTRLKRTLPRLLSVLRDAQAEVILTNRAQLQLLPEMLGASPELARASWVALEEIPGHWAQSWRMPRARGEDLAYLQYTSGSTLQPKGVMISHKNMVVHLRQLQEAYGIHDESVLLSWIPHFHDYGLVEGILLPVYGGARGCLLSPRAFLRRPLDWLRAISTFRVTHSQGPCFAYEYCLRRIQSAQCAGLDLSCWETASVGAEPIRVESLERFRAFFGPYGLKPHALAPSYGLAEATLGVSTPHRPRAVRPLHLQAAALERRRAAVCPPGATRGQWLANCGQPLPEVEIRIVDPETEAGCPPGHIGEIWVRSPGVALGYWNRPAETAQAFGARLRDSGEGPFLRTGDLGFLHEGELFIAGRLKDLIIIRGANHHPQDLEATSEASHPALRGGGSAAFAVERGGQTQVVVLAEVERGTTAQDHAGIWREICQALADAHEVAVAAVGLLRAGALPKTSSGKKQRSRCRELFQAGTLELLALWPSPGTNGAPSQDQLLPERQVVWAGAEGGPGLGEAPYP